ncbi:uncharacterized protein TNCV_1303921 [Trichonephila clavipes]|nr:uncharacterized protein TNCV_1303921 [Trichonephila clavipes]
MEAKHANEFRPNDVMWEKTSKGLLRNPDRLLKNTDKRMVYIYNNIFFAKKDFTFGLRTVKSGEIHLIQTTHVPMLMYELPASSLKCRAQPNVIRRSFEPHDQMLYHRTILEPHTAYPIPAGTHYIVLTFQKTAFGLDIIPESLLPQLIQKGFHVGDFRKMKKLNQTPYKLPPPTPIHVPAESERKTLYPRNECPRTCADSTCPTTTCADSRCPRTCADSTTTCADSRCPRAPVQIPDVLEPVPIPDVPPSLVHIPQPPVHIPQPPVQIPDVPEHVQIPMSQVPQPPMQILPEPMNILHVSEPVQIPDDPEPVQIPVSQVPQSPVQILHVSEPVQIPVSQVPQPPVQSLPELDILDPLESTDAFDQLMSFVFGPQELQLLHTVPSIFDENLFSFLDEIKREPMDLTMPRLNSCVKNIGFKPIQPMDLSVNSSIGQ